MKIIIIFIFFTFLSSFLSAQVFQARVKVEMPLLKPEEKVIIHNFDNRIQDFINSNEWVQHPDPQIVIPVTITIIIQSVYEGGNGYVYVSQFLISSEIGENFYDKNWKFLYLTDEYWNYPINVFHPVTSMLDYYLSMVIAGELDTYSELGGTEKYNHALRVSQEGIRSQYSLGWNQRKEQVLEYTREFTSPLREAKLVYYDALNAFQHKDRIHQLEYGEEMLKLLEQTSRYQANNMPLQRYMEKNARQIAQFFITSNERTAYYNRLLAIDSRFKKDYANILGVSD